MFPVALWYTIAPMDWIYGYNPVLETLRNDRNSVHRLLLSNRRKKGREELEAFGVRIEVVDARKLDDQFGDANHQGIAAQCRPFHYASLLDWVETAPKDAVCVVLDEIQDPGNLGAILRSAVATGASAVIVPARKAAGVTPAAVRASAGLAAQIPVVRVNNLGRALETLKERGFWITGAATRDGVTPWSVDLTGRVAVVVGSEEKGLRRMVADKCDHLVTVPLVPTAESLNVSAAAAMLLYEVIRQRAAV